MLSKGALILRRYKREILIVYESAMLLLISISLATIFIRDDTPKIFETSQFLTP